TAPILRWCTRHIPRREQADERSTRCMEFRPPDGSWRLYPNDRPYPRKSCVGPFCTCFGWVLSAKPLNRRRFREQMAVPSKMVDRSILSFSHCLRLESNLEVLAVNSHGGSSPPPRTTRSQAIRVGYASPVEAASSALASRPRVLDGFWMASQPRIRRLAPLLSRKPMRGNPAR